MANLRFSYGFGLGTADNGNVLAIQNNRDLNRSQNFAYDQLNRIAFAWSSGALWGNKFTIDIWGNLNNKDACQAGEPCFGKPLGEYLNQIADGNNRFVGMTYDSAGNLTNDGGNAYTYDGENRISTTAGVTYTYDGDGERVKKSSGTLYWGLASNEPLAESDLSGNLQKEFIFFGGKRIARLDLPGGAVHYYFSDHLGSSNVVTNATGTTIEEESDFYPFGGERTITDLLPDQRYKFTGKERDPETGLDYFGARYYSSSLGRFMTPDWAAAPTAVPYADFGDPQSLNLYGYVRNNPLSKADPDGHEVPPATDMDFTGLRGIAEGAWNFVKDTATSSAEVMHSLSPGLAVAGGAVDAVHTAVEDYKADGVSGTIDKLAAQGPVGATGVVVEAVLTGGAVASARVTTVTPEAAPAKAPGAGAAEPGKGLGGNPFKGKTSEQAVAVMKGKGFEPKGPAPEAGKGGYVNPKSGRSYHIDADHKPPTGPHVDVNRARSYKGVLPKKKLPLN